MQLLAQVGHEEGAHSDVHSGRGQALAHFRGAGCVASMEPVQVQGRVQGQHLLPLQLLQVADCQLQHISLLQLGDALSLSLEGKHHEVLQLIQAGVDPRPPLPLQQGLHHLPVLVCARHGIIFSKSGFTRIDWCHLVLFRALNSSAVKQRLSQSRAGTRNLYPPGATGRRAGPEKEPWEGMESPSVIQLVAITGVLLLKSTEDNCKQEIPALILQPPESSQAIIL